DVTQLHGEIVGRVTGVAAPASPVEHEDTLTRQQLVEARVVEAPPPPAQAEAFRRRYGLAPQGEAAGHRGKGGEQASAPQPPPAPVASPPEPSSEANVASSPA